MTGLAGDVGALEEEIVDADVVVIDIVLTCVKSSPGSTLTTVGVTPPLLLDDVVKCCC